LRYSHSIQKFFVIRMRVHVWFVVHLIDAEHISVANEYPLKLSVCDSEREHVTIVSQDLHCVVNYHDLLECNGVSFLRAVSDAFRVELSLPWILALQFWMPVPKCDPFWITD